METEKIKLLYSDECSVTNVNGKYLFSVSMTDRAKELNNNEGWIKGKESWLAYRNRTKQDRINEEIKRKQLTKDIVSAYNEMFKLH